MEQWSPRPFDDTIESKEDSGQILHSIDEHQCHVRDQSRLDVDLIFQEAHGLCTICPVEGLRSIFEPSGQT